MATSSAKADKQEDFSDLEAISQQPLTTVHDIDIKEKAPKIIAEIEPNPLDDKEHPEHPEHPEHGNEFNNRKDLEDTGAQIRQFARRHWVLCLTFAALLIILAAVLGGVLGSRGHKDSQKTISLKVRRVFKS